MRSTIACACVALFPLGVLAAGHKEKHGMQPIAVVQVNRKDPLTYDKDIEPILVKKCLVCHSGAVKEGKLDMATYESLMKGGKHGRPITPGKPADSRLVGMAGKTVRPFMPPKTEEPLA